MGLAVGTDVLALEQVQGELLGVLAVGGVAWTSAGRMAWCATFRWSWHFCFGASAGGTALRGSCRWCCTLTRAGVCAGEATINWPLKERWLETGFRAKGESNTIMHCTVILFINENLNCSTLLGSTCLL